MSTAFPLTRQQPGSIALGLCQDTHSDAAHGRVPFGRCGPVSAGQQGVAADVGPETRSRRGGHRQEEARNAGLRYDISILQAEFGLTQVLDRPLAGRVLLEDVIRENLDLGRPSQVQLTFDRRVTKRTPGRFRTRVITNSVKPSLHVDYKHSRIKQYHKEGQALRTETTINDTDDFALVHYPG